MRRRLLSGLAIAALAIWPAGCDRVDKVMASIDSGTPVGCVFVGIDISGSFLRGKFYDDALDFMARCLYAHLKGRGGLEVPHSLFVGTIGGVKQGEPKTFYPIQTFE